jgi:hypothetical protein
LPLGRLSGFSWLTLQYFPSDQLFFLTWADLICLRKNIIQCLLYLGMTRKRVTKSLYYLTCAIDSNESWSVLRNGLSSISKYFTHIIKTTLELIQCFATKITQGNSSKFSDMDSANHGSPFVRS